jgi:hypothetical protein
MNCRHVHYRKMSIIYYLRPQSTTLETFYVGFVTTTRFVDELPFEDHLVVAVLHLGDAVHSGQHHLHAKIDRVTYLI